MSNVWKAARNELAGCIVASDDTDAVEVLTNQGVIRRAISRIDELEWRVDEIAAESAALAKARIAELEADNELLRSTMRAIAAIDCDRLEASAWTTLDDAVHCARNALEVLKDE